MNLYENEDNSNMKVRRNVKDTLFRSVFNNKKDLLSLYNALNGTNYTDESLLEVNTLQESIYLHVKNDISFILKPEIYVMEHQSTVNPNMPLRDLFYISKLYEKYIQKNNIDIYSSRKKIIPAPKFVVFYNGTHEQPEIKELRLSELFETKSDQLELCVIQYNINLGYNKKLLEACKTLHDYSTFIATVRKLKENNKITTEKAVEQTIRYCIENDILKEYLLHNKAEASMWILSEVNDELHNKTLHDEGYEDGFSDGLTNGRSKEREASLLAKKLLSNGESDEAIYAQGISKETLQFVKAMI